MRHLKTEQLRFAGIMSLKAIGFNMQPNINCKNKVDKQENFLHKDPIQKSGLVKKSFQRKQVEAQKPKNYKLEAVYQVFSMKLQIYKDFLFKINFSNGLIVLLPQPFTPYKYKITKGNNSLLIKNAIKQRWWWQRADNDESGSASVNLLWT